MTDEAGFGREPEQRLDHRQCDQFGGGEHQDDPDRRPFGRPLWVFEKKTIDRDVDASREGVQVRVHALHPFGSGFVQAP